MDELERSAQLLREALDELRRQGMVTAQTFAKLNQATNANTAAQQGQTQAVEDAEKGLKKLYDTTKQVIGGFLDTAQQARANREDFTSLNPAIRSTGVVFGKGAKTVGSAVASLGDAITGAGLFFGPKGAVIGLIAGGLIKGLGAGMKAAGEETGKLLAEYGTFITAELQRVIVAFQQVASVGATGAEGMQGFVDMAARSGLGMEQFSAIVAKNGEALAAAGGTTLQGSKALVGLTEASVKFEEQFLKMGIGFTEQRDFYAKFLNQNRLILRMQISDQNALAESAKRYIENIDELARLTGIQRSEAQTEIERQNADIRLQAQKRVAFARGGETLVKQIEGTVGFLEKRGSRELSEGFADAMENMGTKAAQDFAIITGGVGPQIARDLYHNRITQEEAIARVKTAIERNAATSPEIQAKLGKLGTVYDGMYNGAFRLTSGMDMTVESLEEAKKEQKGAQNAQDNLTKEMVKAQKNLQNFAQQLDKLVVNKILPNAASHVEMFTRALSGSIDYINKKLGITTPAGGGGAGGGGGGGGGATGRGAGTPQAAITGPGGASRPSPEAAGTLGAIRDMIGQAESRGDYNVLVGGSKLPELTSMTIAQVLEYQKGMRSRGHESTALGKYQITQDTLIDLVRKMGIDPNTAKFDKAMQDRLADELIVYRGKYNKYAGGAISKERFMRNLSSIWAGLPMDASGRSFYQGVGSNKATMGWDQAMGSFAYGGITSGPRSGYTAMLHGTEAIVPLPGGRSIPVEMTGMTDKMGEQLSMMNQQITSLNELVGLMRTNNDINNKILRTSMN